MASHGGEQACTVGPRVSGTHKNAGSSRSEKLLAVELQQVWTKERRQQHGKFGREARKRYPTDLSYDLRGLINANVPRSLMRPGQAHLLRLGIFPTGYIYPREERAVRDLLRKRGQLVRQRSTQILRKGAIGVMLHERESDCEVGLRSNN